MIFNGRWVPSELMNLILVLWLVATVIIGTLLYRMRAKGTPPKQQHRQQTKAVKRQNRRKKK
jgi:hypothetical protein